MVHNPIELTKTIAIKRKIFKTAFLIIYETHDWNVKMNYGAGI